ncbi:unnamed protein product [Allacma fusca]|uniref:Uncharacterized protein n=1 Tax=Allacma fusca TaxID=39272 RepID=A0A8J2J3I3_9HEXA|nr:unnamed protein product [Allacma fusca]
MVSGKLEDLSDLRSETGSLNGDVKESKKKVQVMRKKVRKSQECKRSGERSKNAEESWEVKECSRVIFNIVNLCKIKTLFRDGMTPLVKTSSRPKWQRLPGKYVYYHKSPEHRNHYILSFAFAFDREEDVYQFAFSFPFSYSRCQAHLDLVEQKELAFFKRETISLSLPFPNHGKFGTKLEPSLILFAAEKVEKAFLPRCPL